MNYKKILILSSVITVPMLFADFTYKKVSGGHPGSTGSPGELTCAKSGCHAGTVTQNNNTVNQLIFPTADSTYVPGQTYLIKVKVTKANIQRFGFQIEALKDGPNTNIGTFALTQTARTQIITHVVSSNTRYQVTHVQAGTPAFPTTGQNEWQFNWTAPSTNQGPITFYYATNCTNNNGLNSGDQTYTNSFKIKPASATAINEIINENEVIAFYNSDGGYFDLQYNLKKDATVFVRVLDVSGREVVSSNSEYKSKGVQSEKINLNANVSSGVYFLNINFGGRVVTKKIFVK